MDHKTPRNQSRETTANKNTVIQNCL